MSGPPAITRKILGHYRLLQEIGSGGMGVVYRARDERLDRDVAIKLLPPHAFADQLARKRFRREALTLSKLSHPHIGMIFDFDTDDGLDFLVMEYVPGVSLADKLSTGPLLENEVLALTIQICSALEEAHANGIIHCDLKPANIMVKASGDAKLLDFGVSTLLYSSGTASTESVADLHRIGGTLPYMSPEQLRATVLDARTDVYSTGVVLYEMITGHRPFGANIPTLLVDEILNKQPTPPVQRNPLVSPALQNIVLKCLEKDPAVRYQSARELSVDLRQLASPSSVRVESQTPQQRKQTRRRIQVTALVLLLVAIIVGVHQEFWKHSSQRRQKQLVLVGSFQNRTNEPGFDIILPELLTINLEQSGYVSVFPTDRTIEVMKRMQRPPSGFIDEVTGREICQREGLNAVIVGAITKLGAQYVLTARAVVGDGRTVASTEEVVSDVAKLPNSVDSISKYFRKAFGESEEQVEATSAPLAEVTSSSLDALRSFTIGKQELYAGSLQDAMSDFQAAVDLDPSFAMARGYLGIAYLHQGEPVRAEEELKQALPFINRVTAQEREKIRGDYNFLHFNFDEAIVHYKKLKELHPDDPAPDLNLAQCYLGKLQFESAIAATKSALQLQSGSGPENNLAEIYLMKGDLAEARRIVDRVLARDGNNSRALEIRGWSDILNGRISEGQQTFEHMANLGGDSESRGRSALADLALASGRNSEAIRQLRAICG